jgi:hypothetical protein
MSETKINCELIEQDIDATKVKEMFLVLEELSVLTRSVTRIYFNDAHLHYYEWNPTDQTLTIKDNEIVLGKNYYIYQLQIDLENCTIRSLSSNRVQGSEFGNFHILLDTLYTDMMLVKADEAFVNPTQSQVLQVRLNILTKDYYKAENNYHTAKYYFDKDKDPKEEEEMKKAKDQSKKAQDKMLRLSNSLNKS